MNDELDVDDDFLNVRFDPKFKQIFKEKIDALQGEFIAEDYLLPVRFNGSFSGKTRKYLHTMVGRVTKSAGLSGLRLRTTDPEIVFYTEKAWEKNKNDALNLPASTINWQGSKPIIQVITPAKIDSSETIIKTVRLLFSKLFGTLFFEETVLSRKPYLTDTDQSASTYDTKEKTHFCRLLGRYPQHILDQIVKLAINKKLPKEKQVESGKNEFFRLLGDNPGDQNSLYLDMLNTVFAEHLTSATTDSQSFFKIASSKVFETLPKLGLVLPHELKYFSSLKDRMQWELFDGIADKAQYLKGCIDDLVECANYLESLKSDELEDFSTSDYWMNVLNNRIVYLKRKGLVKLFLIEDSRLTINQRKDMLGFPLWVWRQRLFENYPKTVPSNKILKNITSLYKNSLYQKILEASFRAVNSMKMLQSHNRKEFAASPDYKRFCSLLAGIKIRLPILEDLLHTSRIVPQMVKVEKIDTDSVTKASKQFEKGWSYFISFALVHQFYLSRDSIANDKATRFLKIIKQHLESKLENKVSLQISYLLLLLYINKHYKLDELINIVVIGSNTFDFFVMNRNKIQYQNMTMAEVIKNYSKSLSMDN